MSCVGRHGVVFPYYRRPLAVQSLASRHRLTSHPSRSRSRPHLWLSTKITECRFLISPSCYSRLHKLAASTSGECTFRAKNKEAKEDPVAEGGSKQAEPIKEGPFGLKSSKEGQEEGPVNDQQVKHPTKEAAGKVLGDEHASRLDRALEHS